MHQFTEFIELRPDHGHCSVLRRSVRPLHPSRRQQRQHLRRRRRRPAGRDPSQPPILDRPVGQLQNFAGFEDGSERDRTRNETCIQGRKIELTATLDDAGDPQKNLDAVRNLVDSLDSTAIIEASTVLLPIYRLLGLPEIPSSDGGFSRASVEPTWGYGFNGCLSGYALDVTNTVEVPGAKAQRIVERAARRCGGQSG